MFISSGGDGAGDTCMPRSGRSYCHGPARGRDKKERRQAEKACLCDSMCDTLGTLESASESMVTGNVPVAAGDGGTVRTSGWETGIAERIWGLTS